MGFRGIKYRNYDDFIDDLKQLKIFYSNNLDN